MSSSIMPSLPTHTYPQSMGVVLISTCVALLIGVLSSLLPQSLLLFLLVVGTLFLFLYAQWHPVNTMLLMIPLLILSPTMVGVSLPPPFSELRASDVILVILGLRTLQVWVRRPRPALRPEVKHLFLISAGLGVSHVISLLYASGNLGAPVRTREFLVALAYLQWPFYVLVVYTIVGKRRKGLSNFVPAFVVATLVSIVLGLLQYLGVGRLQSFLDRWYPRLGAQAAVSHVRITSTFDGSPNLFAGFLTLVLTVFTAHLLADRKRPLPYRWPYVVALMLGSITLALTASRAQLLAAAASLVFLFVVKRRWWLGALLILAFLAYFTFTPESHISRWEQIQVYTTEEGVEVALSGGAGLRVEKFREVWRLIQDTPIFGLGSSKFLITTTDNLYTRVLLDTGFLGLALYFLLTGYVFYLGYRVHRHFPPGWQSVLGLSVMAFLVAVYVGNMGARVLSFPRVDELFWLLVGSVVAILPSAQATPAPSLRGGGFEG